MTEHENVPLFLSRHLCPLMLYAWQYCRGCHPKTSGWKTVLNCDLSPVQPCAQTKRLSQETVTTGFAGSKICLQELQKAPSIKKPYPLLNWTYLLEQREESTAKLQGLTDAPLQPSLELGYMVSGVSSWLRGVLSHGGSISTHAPCLGRRPLLHC